MLCADAREPLKEVLVHMSIGQELGKVPVISGRISSFRPLVCLDHLQVVSLAWVASSSSCPEPLDSLVLLKAPPLRVLLDPDKIERVYEQIRLDVIVQGWVGRKARGKVNLEDVRLEVSVKNDVEAEKLKAPLSRPSTLNPLSSSQEMVFDRNNCFDYRIVDSLPDGLHVYPHLFQMRLQIA